MSAWSHEYMCAVCISGTHRSQESSDHVEEDGYETWWGAGNWTWVFCKGRKCLQPPSLLYWWDYSRQYYFWSVTIKDKDVTRYRLASLKLLRTRDWIYKYCLKKSSVFRQGKRIDNRGQDEAEMLTTSQLLATDAVVIKPMIFLSERRLCSMHIFEAKTNVGVKKDDCI